MRAITIPRCSATDESGLLICGRSKGHDGYHETPILGSDMIYTWAHGDKAISNTSTETADAPEIPISRR